METKVRYEQLIIPVYINEKIVLDMLAIIEDGFSTVSQVSFSEQNGNDSSQKAGVNATTSVGVPFLSKLLKIDLQGGGELTHNSSQDSQRNTTFEKVHTNVSLLSKLRTALMNQNGCLKTDFNVSKMRIGDFIELEGELQKNPLIDYLDSFIDLYHISDIFSNEPELGKKKSAKQEKAKDEIIAGQIKSFRDELVQSGTTDFILKDRDNTVVLSVQNQYLANDNISEILGGRFRVLGKVIATCKDESESINLLRKTSLSLIRDADLQEIFQKPMEDVRKKLNLPDLVTKIKGPAIIVLPISIYA